MTTTADTLGLSHLARVSELYATQPVLRLQLLTTRHGSCKNTDPESFFPEAGQGEMADRVKSICVTCPVRLECLTVALRCHEKYGIWGGLTYKRRLAALERIRALSTTRAAA